MERIVGWIIGTTIAWIIVAVVVFVTVWTPLIAPWAQERRGLANLRQAEQERKILIEQAKAEKESAQLRAEAIKIIGQAAQDFPEYRNQEFIGAFAEALNNGTIDKIIYVPTEANIPILEAGKRSQ